MCGPQAQRRDGTVLRRSLELPGDGKIREFNHNEAASRGLALNRHNLACAHDVFPAEVLDDWSDSSNVLAVHDGIGDVDFSDDVGGGRGRSSTKQSGGRAKERANHENRKCGKSDAGGVEHFHAKVLSRRGNGIKGTSKFCADALHSAEIKREIVDGVESC